MFWYILHKNANTYCSVTLPLVCLVVHLLKRGSFMQLFFVQHKIHLVYPSFVVGLSHSVTKMRRIRGNANFKWKKNGPRDARLPTTYNCCMVRSWLPVKAVWCCLCCSASWRVQRMIWYGGLWEKHLFNWCLICFYLELGKLEIAISSSHGVSWTPFRLCLDLAQEWGLKGPFVT